MEVITETTHELRFRVMSVGFLIIPYFFICVFLLWFAWPKGTNFKSIYKLKERT